MNSELQEGEDIGKSFSTTIRDLRGLPWELATINFYMQGSYTMMEDHHHIKLHQYIASFVCIFT